MLFSGLQNVCSSAFQQLKDLLTSSPVLVFPKFGPGCEFIVETDASYVGLGAVLSQQQEDGRVHPIAYASRSFDQHERNYGVTEHETLGLVWAVRYFRSYLLGHRTIVYTDHGLLITFESSKTLWKISQMGYDYPRNGFDNKAPIGKIQHQC